MIPTLIVVIIKLQKKEDVRKITFNIVIFVLMLNSNETPQNLYLKYWAEKVSNKIMFYN